LGLTARRDFKAMEQRRFRALRLLEKGLSQAEVARRTKVSRREFGFACHATTALRVLRDRLGWSCQKPVGRALERDEAAIATRKRQTWPALKKRPAPKAARSSSSTKAV
jgi:transposase